MRQHVKCVKMPVVIFHLSDLAVCAYRCVFVTACMSVRVFFPLLALASVSPLVTFNL